MPAMMALLRAFLDTLIMMASVIMIAGLIIAAVC